MATKQESPLGLSEIQNAPQIKSGAGRVITATFHHSSGDVIDLVVGDNSASPQSKIGTTSNHPFWSVDRQEYVQAGQLVIGERLQTHSGDTKRVVSKLARPGPEPVYNLEVFAEHVYYVGKDGVLVHNNHEAYGGAAAKEADEYITLLHGTSSNRASKIVGNSLYPTRGFAGNTVYLAEDVATARHFALESIAKYHPGQAMPKSLSIIEFQIPRKLADRLGIGRSGRSRIGEDTYQMFPDIDGGTGFERIIRDTDIRSFNEALQSGLITARRLKLK